MLFVSNVNDTLMDAKLTGLHNKDQSTINVIKYMIYHLFSGNLNPI